MKGAVYHGHRNPPSPPTSLMINQVTDVLSSTCYAIEIIMSQKSIYNCNGITLHQEYQ